MIKSRSYLSAIEYLGNDAFTDQKLILDFAKRLDSDDIKDLQNASKGYPYGCKNRVNSIITTYSEKLSH